MFLYHKLNISDKENSYLPLNLNEEARTHLKHYTNKDQDLCECYYILNNAYYSIHKSDGSRRKLNI